MGGTLGAILGILLSAFASSLLSLRSHDGASATINSYTKALASAVTSLKAHTNAREGDSTVMDVLLPFADVFSEQGNFSTAVQLAKEKAEGTKFLKPKFGRASYIRKDKDQEVPDPGAWALYEVLSGMAKGMTQI